MSDRRRKFLTAAQAAKLVAGFGWHGHTDAELLQKLETGTGWRLIDSLNLARIADAMERIAAEAGVQGRTPVAGRKGKMTG